MQTTLSIEELQYVETLKEKISSVLTYINTKKDSEVSFRLYEMLNRYLPDTIKTYESIPPVLRKKERFSGGSAQQDFFEKLDLLNAGFHKYSEQLLIDKDTQLAKNKCFLEKVIDVNLDLKSKNNLLTVKSNQNKFVKSSYTH